MDDGSDCGASTNLRVIDGAGRVQTRGFQGINEGISSLKGPPLRPRHKKPTPRARRGIRSRCESKALRKSCLIGWVCTVDSLQCILIHERKKESPSPSHATKTNGRESVASYEHFDSRKLRRHGTELTVYETPCCSAKDNDLLQTRSRRQ